jgi:hypothetical protein
MLCGAFLFGSDSPQKPSSRTLDLELENIAAVMEFSFKAKPVIREMQIHHVFDRNGNGKIEYPQELEKVYFDTSQKYFLHVKEPIPAIGELRFYVPEQDYLGTCVDTKIGFTEATPPGSIPYSPYRSFSSLRTNVVDLTNRNQTNSYVGKPLGVGSFPLEENITRLRKTGRTGVIMYTFTVMGRNGASHMYIYSVDCDSLPLQKTNVLRAPQESK